MKKLAAVMLFLSLGLYAQTQPPAQSATTTPSAVEVFPANAASRESVLRMLEVLQVKRNMHMLFQGMADAGKNAGRQAFLQKMPNATEEQLKILDSTITDSFKLLNIDDLIDLLVNVYRRHLSQSDVDGIIAFYEGPIGGKYLTEQPAMMQESMKATQEYTNKHMSELIKQNDERMKEMIEAFKKQEQSAKPATKPANPASPKK